MPHYGGVAEKAAKGPRIMDTGGSHHRRQDAARSNQPHNSEHHDWTGVNKHTYSDASS